MVTTVLGLPGSGKEQPNSEPVLTTNGWLAIGELKVGDLVIGSDGQPTEVTGVYPQGVKEVFNVSFTDGDQVRCGLEHLWQVSWRSHGIPRSKALTVAEMLAMGISSPCGKNRFTIPQTAPHTGITNLRHAWQIGYALGNGCFKAAGFLISCHTNHLVTVKMQFDRCFNAEGKVRRTSPLGYQIYYPWHAAPDELALYRGQEIKQYLNTNPALLDISSRSLLLAGLIDSDGSVAKNNSMCFNNTSEPLMGLVVTLTKSLGGIARKQKKPDTRKPAACYGVSVSLPQLSLKIKKYSIPHNSKLSARIKSICNAGYSEESTCITVASTDKLYVTANYKLTHNSSYCKIKSAEDGVTWRPEPTDDVDRMRRIVGLDELNQIILDRFLTIDCVTSHAYRDSDYWTASVIFGGRPTLNELLAPVSEKLIWIRVSPEQQRENIIKRNRPFYKSELQYTKKFWHDLALSAFQEHPATEKIIIEPTSEPFTWKTVQC